LLTLSLEGEGLPTLILGPFSEVRFDDCSIFVVDPERPERVFSAVEWSYGETTSGWMVEPPYGESEEFYPFARVVPA
jgi:hypothetical protein